MQKLMLVTLIAGLTTGGVYAAQAAADRAAVEKQIAAAEQKINDAFAKKDVAGMKANIADDAYAIDPTGANSVTEFFKQLPTMDVKVTDVKLTDFAYHWVDANNVVMTYKYSGKGTVMGQPVQPTTSSTLYTKRNGKWLAYFHQETPVLAPPAAPAKPAAAAKPAAPTKK